MPYCVNDTTYWDGDVKVHYASHALGAKKRHGPFRSKEEAVLVAVNVLASNPSKKAGCCYHCRIEIVDTLPVPCHCHECRGG